jgi:AmiR/NasT family two-component response regulator
MTPHEGTSAELVDARQRVADLQLALETRHMIGVAQGLLMARYGLSTEQAFEYLRRLSQDGNVKLRRLADGVVREWHEVGCLIGEFDPKQGEPA